MHLNPIVRQLLMLTGSWQHDLIFIHSRRRTDTMLLETGDDFCDTVRKLGKQETAVGQVNLTSTVLIIYPALIRLIMKQNGLKIFANE